MKDALCCLFICYLTVRMMMKTGQLMEKKGLMKPRKEPNRRPIFMINVFRIMNNHFKK